MKVESHLLTYVRLFVKHRRVFIFSLVSIVLVGQIFAVFFFGQFLHKGISLTDQQKAILGDETAAGSYGIPLDASQRLKIQRPTLMTSDLDVYGKTSLHGGIELDSKKVNLGNGSLYASNILYSLSAGKGISVGEGQSPQIQNMGVLSLQGQTGNLLFSSNNGIGIDGLS